MTPLTGHARSQRIREIERLMQMRKKRNPWRMQLKIAIWKGTVAFAKFVKSLTDFLGSLILLILFSPLFLITGILIYINNPGPIFYIANRVGLNGAFFGFIKFRSMYVDADSMKDQLLAQNESKDGVIFKMKKDPRVTPIGRFIRRFSIDELPQLINVLKGDMSLVGPRPPLPQEVQQYTLQERKRLHVKPGITCLWQIKGRSEIPFQQQVQLDLEYIRSQGLKEDLRILLKTIPAVISGRGAY
jgi:lipopolysaccharide/colanic/teichoic acid biosynthesis glycosyltransferase